MFKHTKWRHKQNRINENKSQSQVTASVDAGLKWVNESEV